MSQYVIVSTDSSAVSGFAGLMRCWMDDSPKKSDWPSFLISMSLLSLRTCEGHGK